MATSPIKVFARLIRIKVCTRQVVVPDPWPRNREAFMPGGRGRARRHTTKASSPQTYSAKRATSAQADRTKADLGAGIGRLHEGQGMGNHESTAGEVVDEPNLREGCSSKQPSLRSLEQGRRLVRIFLNIRNPTVRNLILDMVLALAWQDSQIRPHQQRRASAEH